MTKKLNIDNIEKLKSLVGKEIGTSNYLTVTQEMVNKFADATLDHQWIHVDVERAKKESPFKKTIAHGYLTISLAPHLLYQFFDFTSVKMVVNYGIENLRLMEPVVVGSDIRLKLSLVSIRDLKRMIKLNLKLIFEIKGSEKEACEAEVVYLVQR